MGPPPEEGIAGLCVYATEEGCACYEERPLMCRLFGAVENLRCPHGCAPAVLLTRGAAQVLLEAYAREADVELTAVRLLGSPFFGVRRRACGPPALDFPAPLGYTEGAS